MSDMAIGNLEIRALVSVICLCALFGCAQPKATGVSDVNSPFMFDQPAETQTLARVISTANQTVANPQAEAVLKEIQPGEFLFGDIKISRRKRTVSFPAVINLTQGQMEYFLVSSWGKVHESIFRTDTEPYRIHVAMLLLGVKGADANGDSSIDVDENIISHPSKARLPGEAVTLEIKWVSNGKAIRRNAGELIVNVKSKSALRRGDWAYNGSFMVGNSFLAQREGSIVSLVTDPESLINNASPGHDDDTIWSAYTKRLPGTNATVEIVIGLQKAGHQEKR